MPYILQPSRVIDRSATLIDHIFAETFNFYALSGNISTKISDHFPQFLIIEDLKVNYTTLNYYKHDYSHFSEEAFVDEVSHLDFSPIYNYYSNLNTNGKLIFSMTKSTLFVRYMYLIRGFPRRRLKYPPNLGLLKKSLLK